MHQIDGLSESEVLKIIDSIVGHLGPGYVFGCYTLADIQQEGRLEALKVLSAFDPTRGVASATRNTLSDRLYNFLRTHITYRYRNLLRDNLERAEVPDCHCEFCLTGETDKCKRYQRFLQRNTAKRLIAQAAPESLTSSECYVESHEVAIENEDLIHKMNQHLPAYLRPDFKRMLEQVQVPSTRRDKIRTIIKGIMESGTA